ncbi:MAG: hypothetical protein ABIJ08_06380 [Nanoarchaeota archaeon]
MIDLMRLIGIAGLILIIIGIMVKDRKTRDYLYIPGGICLTIYSINLKDTIFIILQVVFTIVAIYDLFKLLKKR